MVLGSVGFTASSGGFVFRLVELDLHDLQSAKSPKQHWNLQKERLRIIPKYFIAACTQKQLDRQYLHYTSMSPVRTLFETVAGSTLDPKAPRSLDLRV